MNQQLYFDTDVERIRKAQDCFLSPRLYFETLEFFLYVESIISLFIPGNGL